jgi:hypothetical protein
VKLLQVGLRIADLSSRPHRDLINGTQALLAGLE